MKTKSPTSIRFDEDQLKFIKEKENLQSGQDVVNFLMNGYWEMYHPRKPVFGMPEPYKMKVRNYNPDGTIEGVYEYRPDTGFVATKKEDDKAVLPKEDANTAWAMGYEMPKQSNQPQFIMRKDHIQKDKELGVKAQKKSFEIFAEPIVEEREKSPVIKDKGVNSDIKIKRGKNTIWADIKKAKTKGDIERLRKESEESSLHDQHKSMLRNACDHQLLTIKQ